MRDPTVPRKTLLSSKTFLESSRKCCGDSEQAHVDVRKRVRLSVVLPLTEDLPAGVVSRGAARRGGQGHCPPDSHLLVTKGRAGSTCRAPGRPAGGARTQFRASVAEKQVSAGPSGISAGGGGRRGQGPQGRATPGSVSTAHAATARRAPRPVLQVPKDPTTSPPRCRHPRERECPLTRRTRPVADVRRGGAGPLAGPCRGLGRLTPLPTRRQRDPQPPAPC